MKKFLLLPLIALMFIGCSKDALTSDPGMEANQAVRTDGPYPIKLVVAYSSIFKPDADFPLTISYMGEDWDMHTFTITGPGTYDLVARGGSLSFAGLMKYDGHAPYVQLKYQPDDESMVYSELFTMPEEIYMSHGIPIGEPIFGDAYTVRVSFEEVF